MERMMSTTVGTFLILLYTLAILLNSFVLGAFVKHGYQSYFMRKVIIAFTSQNIFAAGLSLLLVSIWMCNPDILVHPSTTCKLILLTVTLVLVQLSATTFLSMAWMILSIKQPLRIEAWANSSIMQWSYITGHLFSVIYIIPIGADWIISNLLSGILFHWFGAVSICLFYGVLYHNSTKVIGTDLWTVLVLYRHKDYGAW